MENILTDENFDNEVKAIDKFVLVDFSATWCGPCQVLGPILERVSEKFKDKVVLMKANVDNFPKTSQKFEVEKIPMVVLLKNAEIVNGFVGLIPEKSIEEWLDNAIKTADKK
jgi:thioredoxin